MKGAENLVGTPSSEKFYETGGDSAFQEGGSPSAPQSTNRRRLGCGAGEGVAAQVLVHQAVRDRAGCTIGIIVGVQGGRPRGGGVLSQMEDNVRQDVDGVDVEARSAKTNFFIRNAIFLFVKLEPRERKEVFFEKVQRYGVASRFTCANA